MLVRFVHQRLVVSRLALPATVTDGIGVATRRLALFLRARWFTIDHRTLGLFRIAFALCLIGNLYDHAAGGNLVAFFTNDGVLSNHLALFAPIQYRAWSLLFAFSTPAEVTVAFTAILGVYLLYLVGWKTRLMQVLVIVCFISIVNRNLLLQDGGSFTCTLLAVWTAFLPLGARFSVDRWLAPPPPATAPAILAAPRASAHVSFVCFALLAQLAAIYGFNAANKSGQTWHTGTAVHYILWQLSRNTALAGFLRLHEPAWLSPVLSWGTLGFEWAAPVLVLSPVLQTACRRMLVLGMWLLHLGIASLMSLGPFSYAMLAFSILLLRPDDWESLAKMRIARRLRRHSWRLAGCLLALVPVRVLAFGYRCRARLLFPAGSPPISIASFPLRRPRRITTALRETVAVFMFVTMLAELTLANAIVPERLRWTSRPQFMADVLYYLRVYQTWGMFAADVPTTDGGLVVDAVLADGSRIDLLTGRPPDFAAPLHGPYGLDHDWSEYMFYYPWERHRAYRAGLRDYLVRRHEARLTTPEKRLRSFDIYWVTADCPAPGEREPRNIKRELMISYRADP